MENKALELSKKYKSLLKKYEITTPLRLAHFFAQIDHESGLKPKAEDLSYSVKRLREIFKKYFTEAQLPLYANNPEKIGNRVYANRMGNGSEYSGDGFKYRGRGFIMITGKDNYKLLSDFAKVDYILNPNLLINEADSMISALWYWKTINANKYADQDNLDTISDLINIGRPTKAIGDANGYIDREKKLKEYKKIFTDEKK